MASLTPEVSACWFRRKRACQPVQCVYYQQPVYQQPVYPSSQSRLTPLNPLPQLPRAYFPPEQP